MRLRCCGKIKLMSQEVSTKYFVDSSSVTEIKELSEKSGKVSGVTTNPTSISQSLPNGITENDAIAKYIERVVEINEVVKGCPISLQVPVDWKSTTQDIISKAHSIYRQVPIEVNVFLKLPVIKSALDASIVLSQDNIPLNFTLVFSQVQLAAIHGYTKAADPESIFASVFIRRMYNPPINTDTGLPTIISTNGMDLVENGHQLLSKYKSHVKLLAASIGDVEDILGATFYGADIITIPYKPFSEWIEAGLPLPGENYHYTPRGNRLKYEEFDLKRLNLNKIPSTKHILTQRGLDTFNQDWNKPRKMLK